MSEKFTRKKDALYGFDMREYAGKLIETVRIQNFIDSSQRGFGKSSYLLGSTVALYGNITKINGSTITVMVSQEQVKQMHGYKLWKKDADIVDVNMDRYDQHRKLIPVIMKWGDGTDEDRTYRFEIDKAVRVTRNSDSDKSASDLKVGDYVNVMYHMWYETLHKGKCVIYPEYLRASTPVEINK
jgi:hypothetical protein